MKASDLRLGNLVWLKAHQAPVTIEEIWKEFNDEYWISTDLHEGELLSLYEPIPLTPEWLERFGFEEKGSTYDKGLLSVSMPSEDPFLWRYGRTYFNSWKILDAPKYVHQLQNIYTALTGELLTIK